MAGEEQFSGVEPLFELSNVVVYAEEEEFGTGSITITEHSFDWLTVDKSLTLNIPQIGVHAVSRDTSVFPFKPCLVVLYSEPSEDHEDTEVTKTYRFCAESLHQLDVIYGVLSDCQQLYPDTELSSDSEEEEEYFTTVEGLQHLSVEGETVLSHLENILIPNQNSVQNGNTDQFEDATNN